MHFQPSKFLAYNGFGGCNPFVSQGASVIAVSRKTMQDFGQGHGISGSLLTTYPSDVVWQIVGQQVLDSGK